MLKLFKIHVYVDHNVHSECIGGLAQMVERMVCIHEALGSIPWSSNFYTNKIQTKITILVY